MTDDGMTPDGALALLNRIVGLELRVDDLAALVAALAERARP